jgi:hypothetical protein
MHRGGNSFKLADRPIRFALVTTIDCGLHCVRFLLQQTKISDKNDIDFQHSLPGRAFAHILEDRHGETRKTQDSRKSIAKAKTTATSASENREY